VLGNRIIVVKVEAAGIAEQLDSALDHAALPRTGHSADRDYKDVFTHWNTSVGAKVCAVLETDNYDAVERTIVTSVNQRHLALRFDQGGTDEQ
jgi:hypothetical protein